MGDGNAVVKSLDLPASNGEITFDFGFKPRMVILAFNGISTINTHSQLDCGLSVSFITETEQHSIGTITEQGVTTSGCHSVLTNKAIKSPSISGGTLWEADFVEFTNSGLKLDFTSVDVARKAVAIGFR